MLARSPSPGRGEDAGTRTGTRTGTRAGWLDEIMRVFERLKFGDDSDSGDECEDVESY